MQQEMSSQENKDLIVYYSMNGHCEKIASNLERQLCCDMEKLIDKSNYKGFTGVIKCSAKALLKKSTHIKPVKYSPGYYDRIILVTPIWADNITPALRTYLSDHKEALQSKKVYLITCSGLSNAKGCVSELYRSFELKIDERIALKIDEVEGNTFHLKISKLRPSYVYKSSESQQSTTESTPTES